MGGNSRQDRHATCSCHLACLSLGCCCWDTFVGYGSEFERFRFLKSLKTAGPGEDRGSQLGCLEQAKPS